MLFLERGLKLAVPFCSLRAPCSGCRTSLLRPRFGERHRGQMSSDATDALPCDIAEVLSKLFALPKPPRTVLSVTGSGGQALAWLLAVPGSSAVLLEATVPYCTTSSRQWQGGVDIAQGFCSEEAAVALAQQAFRRAISLTVTERGNGFAATAEAPIVGIGCTASVASTRPKKGPHRCYVAAASPTGTCSYFYELAKGSRDRLGEDIALSRLVVRALAEAIEMPLPPAFVSTGVLPEEETPVAKPLARRDALEALRDGDVGHVVMVPAVAAAATTSMSSAVATAAGGAGGSSKIATQDLFLQDPPVLPPAVIFPGSFNPLHGGHVALLDAATRVYIREVLKRPMANGIVSTDGVTTLFEVSVSNADKGMLPLEEVRARAAQFASEGTDLEATAAAADLTAPAQRRHPIALTRVPLFIQKARLFPGCAFVVGADTARRILDPKYYGSGAIDMVAALAEMKALGCCFIVGGRRDGEDFLTMASLLEKSPLPPSLNGMFHEVPAAEFRADVSSTALRQAAGRGR